MSLSHPRIPAMIARALSLAVIGVLSFAPAARAQAGIEINPGDTVTVATGQGWVLAIVNSREQHLFNVRVINGPGTFKRYPAELRRRGKTNAYDHANGIHEVGDIVKVHYEGKWIDSKILTGMGMEYQVALPGNMMAWAKPEQIRFVSEAPPKDVAKAGKAPRPGVDRIGCACESGDRPRCATGCDAEGIAAAAAPLRARFAARTSFPRRRSSAVVATRWIARALESYTCVA